MTIVDLGGADCGMQKMKNAVANLFRFVSKPSDKPDAFGQRLTVMTKAKTQRPTRATPPSVFRAGQARAA